MTRRAPIIGWGAILGAALAASFASLPVQLGFAVLAIGVIGMAHGASDLAIVEDRRKRLFLILYAAVSAACLLWWVLFPAVALPLFLMASAVHFGLEDAPSSAPVERALRGIALVAAPAALHQAELHDLLTSAGGSPSSSMAAIRIMAAAGGVAAAGLLVLAIHRSDRQLAIGTMSLLILPPLVGFSVGFLILHAAPQTVARQRQIGCESVAAYVRQVAPLMAGAILIVAVIGAVVLRQEVSGVRSLFAAVAALAIPHLLVTPLFERSLADDHSVTHHGRPLASVGG